MTSKGKERETLDLTEAEKLKRSFERSLAGPSVGKAGLIRDQTGELVVEARLMGRGQQDHRRGIEGETQHKCMLMTG
jgi:hypothetical protein